MFSAAVCVPMNSRDSWYCRLLWWTQEKAATLQERIFDLGTTHGKQLGQGECLISSQNTIRDGRVGLMS